MLGLLLGREREVPPRLEVRPEVVEGVDVVEAAAVVPEGRAGRPLLLLVAALVLSLSFSLLLGRRRFVGLGVPCRVVERRESQVTLEDRSVLFVEVLGLDTFRGYRFVEVDRRVVRSPLLRIAESIERLLYQKEYLVLLSPARLVRVVLQAGLVVCLAYVLRGRMLGFVSPFKRVRFGSVEAAQCPHAPLRGELILVLAQCVIPARQASMSSVEELTNGSLRPRTW